MSALNVGIMGCGSIAGVMAQTIRRTHGFRMYAAASRDLDKAVGFAKRNHVHRAYGSYEDLVHDRKVDLIYIATPHSEHYANARLCLENGKACLVEKAFTINEPQAAELVTLAGSRNVLLAEAIWIRYMPFRKTIREVLASGVIGEVVMLSANLGYPLQGVPRLTDLELAGGSLLDLGVYPINLASMLFGNDLLRTEVSVTYTPQHLDEQENITLIYRDGRIAALTATMLGETDRRCLISGTKGYVVIDNINNFEGMTVYDGSHRRIATYKRPHQKTGYEYQLRSCRAALQRGDIECPEMPHGETLYMMHVMDGIRAQMGVVYPAELRQGGPAPTASTTWQDSIKPPAPDARPWTGSGPTGQETPAAEHNEIEMNGEADVPGEESVSEPVSENPDREEFPVPQEAVIPSAEGLLPQEPAACLPQSPPEEQAHSGLSSEPNPGTGAEYG